MNANEFIRNSSDHSPDSLACYQEQHVAWSEDGKQILAHADTLDQLYSTIDRLNIDRYVVGFIPNLDASDPQDSTP